MTDDRAKMLDITQDLVWVVVCVGLPSFYPRKLTSRDIVKNINSTSPIAWRKLV